MKKYRFIIFVALWNVSHAQEKPLEVEWAVRWPDQSATSVLALGDSYIIACDSLKKINLRGEALGWKSSVTGARDIVVGHDGGFVALSLSGRIFYLTKVDNEGNTLWSHEFSNQNGFYFGLDLKRVSGGGYIVAGWEQPSSGSIKSSVLILTVDNGGNKLWSKNYTVKGIDKSFGITETSDGGFAVSGIAQSSDRDRGDLLIIRIDSLGNKLWSKVYGDNGPQDGKSIYELSNGDFLIVGTNGGSSPYIGLMKTDSRGNKRWWWGYDNGYGYELVILPDGYLVVGEKTVAIPNDIDIYLIKTDFNGKELWHTQYGQINHRERAFSIASAGDGGYIVGGFYETPFNQTYVLKFGEPSPTQLYSYFPPTSSWEKMEDSVKQFNVLYPTILITHGRNDDKERSELPDWTLEMAKAVYGKIPNGAVNILAWNWMKEADLPALQYGKLLSNSIQQAHLLALKLNELFSERGYARANNLHLIAHSMGTYVVSVCALTMANNSWHIPDQITLLDLAEKFAGYNFIVTGEFDSKIFELRSQHQVYLDLYHGIMTDSAHNCNVWVNIPSAGHELVHTWYQDTVNDTRDPILYTSSGWQERAMINGTLGFDMSPLSGAHRPDNSCGAQELETQFFIQPHIRNGILWDRDDYLLIGERCLSYVPPINNGVISLNEAVAFGGGMVNHMSDTHISMITGSPIGFKITKTIEPTSDYLGFDYTFASAPQTAELKVSIHRPANDETIEIFSMPSDIGIKFPWLNSGLFNISKLQGETIDIIFELNSSGPGATAEIKDFIFWTDAGHFNQKPRANAGSDRAIMADKSGVNILTLDASTTQDPDSRKLMYWWTLESQFLIDGATPEIELENGGYEIGLVVRDEFDRVSQDSVIIEIEHLFRRGDSDGDGRLNITDAIVTLRSLFLDPQTTLCKDAADFNDDGTLNLTDPIATLNFLFTGGFAPVNVPNPEPGLDPTPDLLGCDIPTNI